MFPSTLRMCFYVLILLFLHILYGDAICKPSACGEIRNISYPFRLADDPQHCGDSDYELVCKNNTTLVLYVGSHKHPYNVQSINYENYTIRLADPSIITNDNTCSFAHYSRSYVDFHDIPHYTPKSFIGHTLAWPVTLLSCPYPRNHRFYTKADRKCGVDHSVGSRPYTYVKAGYHLEASEVGDRCTVDFFFMTSMPFQHGHVDNVSVPEIQSSFKYGFEVSWFGVVCRDKCSSLWQGFVCLSDGNGSAVCPIPVPECYFDMCFTIQEDGHVHGKSSI